MNQTEAMYKAKELLGQKSLVELREESWVKISPEWEMNVWQEEESGKYRCAVFPIDSEGDIAGKGINVYSKEMIKEESEYLISYEYTLPTGNKVRWDSLFYSGKSVLHICFPENDIFNHLILYLEEIE